ncbi:MAG: hypothetical protein A2Z02_01245 [Chloroflexi bacterium RBG_16_48_7]|nr:MAG: hypothetical protein A2Z02_01245 [Chloroflexi bacterium RBG_16_48_7]
MKGKLVRYILVTAGSISLAIGIIGIFVPVLPTTPFLLLAAACYLRSSRRFYNWLINNKYFGEYIRNYLEGKGMPLVVKIYTIAFLWIAIGISIFFSQVLVIDIVLALVAIGVTLHITLLRTIR